MATIEREAVAERIRLEEAMERATRAEVRAREEMRDLERQMAARRIAETEMISRETVRRARRLAERDRRSQLQGRSTARRSRHIHVVGSDTTDLDSDPDIPL